MISDHLAANAKAERYVQQTWPAAHLAPKCVVHKAVKVAKAMQELLPADTSGVLNTTLYLAHYSHTEALRESLVEVLDDMLLISDQTSSSRATAHRNLVLDAFLPIDEHKKPPQTLYRRRVIEVACFRVELYCREVIKHRKQ